MHRADYRDVQGVGPIASLGLQGEGDLAFEHAGFGRVQQGKTEEKLFVLPHYVVHALLEKVDHLKV